MQEERNKLWQAYAHGNKDALGELYIIYHRELVLFLNGELKDTFWAEDIASQTIERLLNIPAPEKIGNFEAYLYSIARHICTDHFRKKGRKTSHKLPTYATFQISEVEDSFAKENMELELRPIDKRVWSLLNQGWWLENIALKIGKSVKTVYRSTCHIKQKLKENA
jgi:RNA polymerase sigma factor (sigma-70 family)